MPKVRMTGQRLLWPVSSPFSRRPDTQRPSPHMLSSKLASCTVPEPGAFGVKVTLIGPPTKTYSPGPQQMTKRAGDALGAADDAAGPPKPREPRPPAGTPNVMFSV